MFSGPPPSSRLLVLIQLLVFQLPLLSTCRPFLTETEPVRRPGAGGTPTTQPLALSQRAEPLHVHTASPFTEHSHAHHVRGASRETAEAGGVNPPLRQMGSLEARANGRPRPKDSTTLEPASPTPWPVLLAFPAPPFCLPCTLRGACCCGAPAVEMLQRGRRTIQHTSRGSGEAVAPGGGGVAITPLVLSSLRSSWTSERAAPSTGGGGGGEDQEKGGGGAGPCLSTMTSCTLSSNFPSRSLGGGSMGWEG